MTTPNDRQRQAEEAAKKREKEWSADADWDDPETAAAIANVYDGYLQGWTDADSTPPQQEGDEEAAEKYVEERSVVDYYNASIDNRLYSAFLRGAAHARRAQNAEIERHVEKTQLEIGRRTVAEFKIMDLIILLGRAEPYIKELEMIDSNEATRQWLKDYERMKSASEGGRGNE